jgi:hypothetical protein
MGKRIEERIGNMGTCSKCGKYKRIAIASDWTRNIDESPSGPGSTNYLCEDCAGLKV